MYPLKKLCRHHRSEAEGRNRFQKLMSSLLPTSCELPSWIFHPFLRGARPDTAFSSGVELEYLIVDRTTLEIAPYGGERGVASILRLLESRNGWLPEKERDELIGLRRDGATISIEPGGAIEIATAPHHSLDDLINEMNSLTNELSHTADQLDRALLCAGYHPFAQKEQVSLVPKRRYQLMYPIMAGTGGLGQDMMKLTASIQVTIDFDSEADALRKYALACRLVPVFIALSANSPFRHGERTPFRSFRSHIWTDTDPRRAGLPTGILGAGPGNDARTFTEYASWALDAPVYFLRRAEGPEPISGKTFRELLGSGEPLSEADWELHLSTLFPWIRLRNYIEIRAFDMVPPDLQYALVTLVHALFYDVRGLKAAEDIVGGFDAHTIELLIQEAIRTTGNPSSDTATTSYSSILGSICRAILTIATENTPHEHRTLLAPLKERLPELWSPPESLEEWVRGNLL